MTPEQVPGSLFILLTAWVGMSLGLHLEVLGLALGCAIGWQCYNQEVSDSQRVFLFVAAAAVWAISFVLIAIRTF